MFRCHSRNRLPIAWLRGSVARPRFTSDKRKAAVLWGDKGFRDANPAVLVDSENSPYMNHPGQSRLGNSEVVRRRKARKVQPY